MQAVTSLVAWLIDRTFYESMDDMILRSFDRPVKPSIKNCLRSIKDLACRLGQRMLDL